ncbi:MAG: hypothetical protein HY951_12740 [Bacteroidia bacterium]|nr:hypothetical protein [Bacteroidia bacterium]
MKEKIAFLLCLFIFFNSTFAQNQRYYQQYEEILSELNNHNIFNAIALIDNFLKEYPQEKPMYFNRGIAKFQLNQVNAAIIDFKRALGSGDLELDSAINFYISKEYAANVLAEGYMGKVNLLEENNLKPVFSKADTLRGFLTHERKCFDVTFYNLKVRVKPEEKKIIGKNLIYFNVIAKTKRIQIDLFDNYSIDSILCNGIFLNYERDANAIFIDFNEELNIGDKKIIQINYSGIPREAPNPPWNGGFVWKKKKDVDWIGVSCEHLGASSWWPNKDHLSDKPDSMKITIEVPKELMAICNGNLRNSYFSDSEYSAYEWFVSYPINNYNVTFYAGDFFQFDEIYTNANNSYRFDFYVHPSNQFKAEKYYSKTKDIVETFEKLFGEYPFKNDGIAMIESPFEGMEHQSAIAIGDNYGKINRYDFIKTEYDYLLVHETAHEWWGNAVAIGDMADAWINEGFATYAELLFLEEKYGYDAYIAGVADVMQNIFNIWPMVGERNVNDNTFLSGDIYQKGAIMLHSLRCTMNNDSLFKKLIKDFYNQSKFKINSTDDFLNFVKNFTGKDYSPLLKTFLYYAEPPLLRYSAAIENNDIIFNYKFDNVLPGFEMPFNVLTNNKNSSIKLIGNDKIQSIIIKDASLLYLPTGFLFENKMIHNSFTYYLNDYLEIKDISNYNYDKLIEEGRIIEKYKDGEWKYYYPNGKLQYIINYKLGLMNGKYESYLENGEKEIMKFYKNDTLIDYCYHYKDSVVSFKESFINGTIDTIYYFKNGVLESKGKIVNQKEEGIWQLFHDNGKISAKGEFIDGKFIPDTWKYFDTNGNILNKIDTLSTVNKLPEYRSGLKNLYNDVSLFLKLTENQKPKESGTAYISFLISPTGVVSEFKQENAYSPEFAKEIINVLKSLPRWIPGYFNGNPVYTKVVYPFKYTLKQN